jgi:hypothetical protein
VPEQTREFRDQAGIGAAIGGMRDDVQWRRPDAALGQF